VVVERFLYPRSFNAGAGVREAGAAINEGYPCQKHILAPIRYNFRIYGPLVPINHHVRRFKDLLELNLSP
jgi:hypothetical protein